MHNAMVMLSRLPRTHFARYFDIGGLGIFVNCAALAIALTLPAGAREKIDLSNPLAGNPAAIRDGASLFRVNCSICHGVNAGGGSRGPDLSANNWRHGSGDAEIFKTITHGVSGTEMPANDLEDSEVWSIIAYLRSLAPIAHVAQGNSVNGAKLFFDAQGCAKCHMVKGRGGVLGPDLSRVGASRSSAYLVDSIREPSRDLSVGGLDPNDHYGLPMVYDTVSVITREGARISGIVKNEDTFSIQMMDTDQSIRMFLKSDLQQVIREPKSIMPPYSKTMLGESDLQDLIAYLETLR